MRILTINTSDQGGGAEKFALDLHRSYLRKGLQSFLAVGNKCLDESNTILIDNDPQRSRWAQLWLKINRSVPPPVNNLTLQKLIQTIKWVGQPRRKLAQLRGYEDFDFPASNYLPTLTTLPINILHFHNLHGGYFDPRALIELSQQIPTVLTLHDEWLLTGHCAYTFGCPRWKIGCGSCPDLMIYPAIKRDATDQNWLRKRAIYHQSILYVTTPSEWLANEVRHSMIKFVALKTIPYGIDQSIFRPKPRQQVRNQLGLPDNAFIVLFVAQGVQTNIFKDYATIRKALQLITPVDRPVFCFALGGQKATYTSHGILFREIGYISDPNEIAKYYQAADIFLHAAHADNFPLTILEALSCGTPAIATTVGGIPEQIKDGQTGFLVPPGDSMAMSTKINFLLDNQDVLHAISHRAAEDASLRFNLDRQVSDYLDWYSEVIKDWKTRSKEK